MERIEFRGYEASVQLCIHGSEENALNVYVCASRGDTGVRVNTSKWMSDLLPHLLGLHLESLLQ